MIGADVGEIRGGRERVVVGNTVLDHGTGLGLLASGLKELVARNRERALKLGGEIAGLGAD